MCAFLNAFFSLSIFNHLRNGLAQRASELNKRVHTDLGLWNKEIETKFASSANLRLINPDLCLRIIKVLDLPTGSKCSSPRECRRLAPLSSVSSPGLAICRIVTSGSSAAMNSPNFEHISLTSIQEQDHCIVFSFPRLTPSRSRSVKRVYARNPEDFLMGKEVYVWEPWSEVPLTHDIGLLQPPEELEPLSPFSLPSTFPCASDSLQNKMRPLSGIAIICSRFVIVP